MSNEQIANYKNSLSSNNPSAHPASDVTSILTAIKPISELCALKTKQETQGYLVALGSNKDASKHLAQARAALTALCSNAIWSTEFINPDYTATADNPKPDYTNQCGYLVFRAADATTDLGQVIKTTKVIEKNIQHDFHAANQLAQQDVVSVIKNIKAPKNRQVIIDIDVLGIQTVDEALIAIAERYPFKEHEWVGTHELWALNCFT